VLLAVVGELPGRKDDRFKSLIIRFYDLLYEI
jgi:hypothetical protein